MVRKNRTGTEQSLICCPLYKSFLPTLYNLYPFVRPFCGNFSANIAESTRAETDNFSNNWSIFGQKDGTINEYLLIPDVYHIKGYLYQGYVEQSSSGVLRLWSITVFQFMRTSLSQVRFFMSSTFFSVKNLSLCLSLYSSSRSITIIWFLVGIHHMNWQNCCGSYCKVGVSRFFPPTQSSDLCQSFKKTGWRAVVARLVPSPERRAGQGCAKNTLFWQCRTYMRLCKHHHSSTPCRITTKPRHVQLTLQVVIIWRRMSYSSMFSLSQCVYMEHMITANTKR